MPPVSPTGYSANPATSSPGYSAANPANSSPGYSVNPDTSSPGYSANNPATSSPDYSAHQGASPEYPGQAASSPGRFGRGDEEEEETSSASGRRRKYSREYNQYGESASPSNSGPYITGTF
jgi:hypothetical protein